MNTVTIPDLITYFEKRVHQIDRFQQEGDGGKEPQFPMAVALCGPKAIEGFRPIAGRLFDMWPQYEKEILFLGIDEEAGTMRCGRLTLDQEEPTFQPMGEIGAIVSSLFGLKSHFQDRSWLLLYTVVDTTDLADYAAFSHWISRIDELKRALLGHTLHVAELLLILLNEKLGSYHVAAESIKNGMARTVGKGDRSVLLLSNRRNDYTILEDWEICYRIVADTIALTNNSEPMVANALLNQGIYTAGYACEEKPVGKIGQVVVRQLIERLSQESLGSGGSLSLNRETAEKLGISVERTFSLLDAYAQRHLERMLPTSEQLELFPRRTPEDVEDVSALSEKEFNALTMGAWQAYLDQIIATVQEELQREGGVQEEWKAQYAALLSRNFSVSVLIWLRDHLEDIQDYLVAPAVNPEGTTVLRAAKGRIRGVLSSSDRLMDMFFQVIRQKGQQAEDFLTQWNMLLRSRLTIHAVRDENISQYYVRKTQDYFDYHGAEISAQVRAIQNIEVLSQYLRSLIDKLLESDPIFSVPFEEELEARLRVESLPVNAKQYIRQKLMGENVPVYYRPQFSLGESVISTILIKAGTPLHRNLREHLSETAYYYDTGNAAAAEALNFYAVSQENLISTQGGVQ